MSQECHRPLNGTLNKMWRERGMRHIPLNRLLNVVSQECHNGRKRVAGAV